MVIIVKKRIISLILAALTLVCVFSSLAGCKPAGKGAFKDDPDKEVTLKWALSMPEQSDYKEVLVAINEELAKHMPNTKLELLLDGNMESKWALWMSGGVPIDIAEAGWVTDMLKEVPNDSYLPMNSLIDEYGPNIKAEWEGVYADDYATAVYGDELYGIPLIQYHINDTVAVGIPSDLFEFLDFDALLAEGMNNPKTTRRLYEILDEYLTKAFASDKVDNSSISSIICIKRLYESLAKRGYQFLGKTDSNICYDPYAAEAKIVDFHTTEEFKTFMEFAQKWYSKGYVSQDIFTGGGPGNRAYVLDITMAYGHSEETDKTHKKEDFNKDMGPNGVMWTLIGIDDPKHQYRGFVDQGGMNCQSIPYTSENPARAMRFLDFLHTEAARPLLNLITYGIEGKHWDRVDSSKGSNLLTPKFYAAQGSGSSPYGIPNWLVNNMFYIDVCYPVYSNDTIAYANKYFNELRQNAMKTPVYGLTFKRDAIENSLTQLSAMNRQFEVQVYSGAMEKDTEKTYNEMLAATERVGLKTVLEELQKQVDEYVAKK